MKKSVLLFIKNREYRKRRKEQRKARIRKNKAYKNGIIAKKNYEEIVIIQRRIDFKRRWYRKNKNQQNINNLTIDISKEFGFEDIDNFSYFLDITQKLMSFKGRLLRINLTNCPRICPSGITMLCGLERWFEMTSNPNIVKIASSTPQMPAVENYLCDSGFYNFVRRKTDTQRPPNVDDKLIEIKRKKNRNFSEEYEEKIVDMLKKYSGLDSDGIEFFDAVVLVESFNNVIEHGVSKNGVGCWVMAQVHLQHGYISICIADNGIGIRNSLMSGPQANQIGLKNTPQNDGDFIKEAIKGNISGALEASLKKRVLIKKKYPKGARRGHGLQRIIEQCKKLKIRVSIFSYHGYYIGTDSSKSLPLSGSTKNCIFPGTFYHYLVPLKKDVQND